jgi:3-oxoacyl-(acyl-carrier-protein) synthase
MASKMSPCTEPGTPSSGRSAGAAPSPPRCVSTSYLHRPAPPQLTETPRPARVRRQAGRQAGRQETAGVRAIQPASEPAGGDIRHDDHHAQLQLHCLVCERDGDGKYAAAAVEAHGCGHSVERWERTVMLPNDARRIGPDQPHSARCQCRATTGACATGAHSVTGSARADMTADRQTCIESRL